MWNRSLDSKVLQYFFNVTFDPITLVFSLIQVVRLLDVFAEGAGFVLAFELMLGDLGEMIRDGRRPLTPPQVKSYLHMLLSGVTFLHQRNIMHRVRCNIGMKVFVAYCRNYRNFPDKCKIFAFESSCITFPEKYDKLEKEIMHFRQKRKKLIVYLTVLTCSVVDGRT